MAISGGLITLLQRLKVGRLEQRLANGSTWNGAGFVFIHADSKPLDPAKVSKDFTRIRKAAGLKHVRLHDGRHSHASMLLNAGENAKVVSERLGHASAQITWDIYAHTIPDMGKAAAGRFEEQITSAGAATGT